MSWHPLVASLKPTACKAATQCCGLGCSSLNSSGLNKAGENTPCYQINEIIRFFWGEYLYSIWTAKCFAQELSYRLTYKNGGSLISFFYHTSSLST